MVIYIFIRTIFTANMMGIAWIVSEIIKHLLFHDVDLCYLEWRSRSIRNKWCIGHVWGSHCVKFDDNFNGFWEIASERHTHTIIVSVIFLNICKVAYDFSNKNVSCHVILYSCFLWSVGIYVRVILSVSHIEVDIYCGCHWRFVPSSQYLQLLILNYHSLYMNM